MQYSYDNSQKNRLTALLIIFITHKKGIQYRFKLLPDFGIDAITNTGPFDGPLNQTGVFQFFQVLGYRRLSEAKFVYQITTNTGIALDNML